MHNWIKRFEDINRDQVAEVGGKNASLGEMTRELGSLGVRVPVGFAVTAEAYRSFIQENALQEPIRQLLSQLDRSRVESYERVSLAIRRLIMEARLPAPLGDAIDQAHMDLCPGGEQVAVRSSATAEDLPTASFAGQQESFLFVQGRTELRLAYQRCLASLFTARAIGYREDMGFEHFQVALSVGVQLMVASGEACSGVMFTLDTESGFREVVLINSIWGVGENLVQGRVGPDEFWVHKPTLGLGFKPVLRKRCGSKELRMRFDQHAHKLVNEPVSAEDRGRLTLTEDEILQLARWAVAIEKHYGCPMDIEWAKDAPTGQLYIVQARPETVHAGQPTLKLFRLEGKGRKLATGLAVGDRIGAGPARLIAEPRDMASFKPGEVLVTRVTDPDWEPIMKSAAGIVTERGGRTSHAAIVARELGIPAVVGVENAMELLATGQEITLSCAEGETGVVYEGRLDYSVEEIDPQQLEHPRTALMLNLANPEQAFSMAQLPSAGIGLARMEFVFAGWVRVHPLALLHPEKLSPQVRREVDLLTAGYPEKTDYFIDRLSQGIGTLAGAFWPRDVILRFSDFKTNEYCHLLGGGPFEPKEENPMLGWRGASRYYHPGYREGFQLEVAAVRRVREIFGLTNLKVMIPFCRTPQEGRRVLETMAEGGLERGKNGLEVYCMAEIPSNILQAEEFAALFDGFSIGSNDLTQLILGVDRDSELVAPLFDERNPGVKEACARLIEVAHAKGRKVGICGQAPSDYPEFAAYLVERGIDSISLTPDALVRTLRRVVEMEKQLASHVRTPL